MIGFQYDDGGRADAGRRSRKDCVARAMALITQRPYEDVYQCLAAAQKAAGFARSANSGVNKKVWRKLAPTMGLVKVTLGRGVKPTLTEAHNRYGNCLVTTRKHVIALIDGAVHDTWDSRYTHKPVRGFGSGEYFICEVCALDAATREGWISEYAYPGTEGLISKRIRKPNGDAQLLCPECYCAQEPGHALFTWVVQGERKAMTIWVPVANGQIARA